MAYFISKDCTGCTACKTLCPCDAIAGEKKAMHTILEDHCIECGACGRICPAEAVMDTFGLKLARIPRKEWEKPVFDLDTCTSCTICLDACPCGVISQRLQKVGSLHPIPFLTDEKQCISCGFCAQDCPVDAISMVAQRPASAVKAQG